MNSPFQTLLSLNKSTYKDDQYYASIKPETVKALAEALNAGQVKLNKNGNVAISGFLNTPEDGGERYISLKWVREASQKPNDVPRETPVDNTDVPF